MWTALALFATFATQDVRALDGEWIYVEDRTEGRATESHQPSMSARVRIRIEDDAFVLLRSDGEIRIKFDGSHTDVDRGSFVSRYTGGWKDGAFVYESTTVREPGDTRSSGLIRWELRVTSEGLLARASVDPPTGFTSLALYRRPQDIPLPTPAKATIADVAWIAGDWVGARGTSTLEERWGPPSGGSMFAVNRTVRGERLAAFEYLRILERDGGLVYVAQPSGRTGTEFVLTSFSKTKAVFENPRHDSPQRIVYELAEDGTMSASIGFINGGRPTRFEFKRESD